MFKLVAKNYLFTSESVSEGHPDKVCDQISDSIVDLYLSADSLSRVAVETLCTTNKVVLAGEVRGPKEISHADLEQTARDCVKKLVMNRPVFIGKHLMVPFMFTLNQRTLRRVLMHQEVRTRVREIRE